MSFDTRRFLGFAFANADFLMEIAPDGVITFTAGAAAEFAEATPSEGTPVAALFMPKDGARLAAEVRMLPVGGRRRLKLKLKNNAVADVALFHLPGNHNRISCSLALEGKESNVPAWVIDAATGLIAKDGFLAKASSSIADSDALTLVNVPRLPQMIADLPSHKSNALLAAIGRSFLTSGAKSAGRLTETQFGALADASKGPRSQIEGVRAAIAESGLKPTEIQESHVLMRAPGLRPEQRFLALRYVVERFTSGKKRGLPGSDIGQVFEAMMDETHERLVQLTSMVKDGAFDMAYQPIVRLKDGALSHYEALARFGPGQTGETIQFVEKLGIADSFDLAVALKVIAAMENDKSHAASIAFNVSGHTIQDQASFGMLAGLLARYKKLSPRLLIEITETAEITDMATAANAMQALRQMGFRVGLDDFGSGAATLNYLNAFQVDFVKFDGSLVKRMGVSARDDTMLKAMLNLCSELGFITIAECLETSEDVGRARKAGFDHGQGYFYGAAGTIPAGTGLPKFSLHRRGTSETWE